MYTHPKYDLQLQYRQVLEVSTAIALSLLIIALMISKKFVVDSSFQSINIPAIQLEHIPVIPHIREVEVPPKPVIPVEDPLADIEDNIPIEFPNFNDLLLRDPPPPPELEETFGFYSVQEPPVLIGGARAVVDYIVKHNLYPDVAQLTGVSGAAQVSFIVDRNGVPQDVRILQEKPKGMGFGAAAVKAMLAMRFKPGVQRDKTVRVEMQQTIKFTAQ